MDEEISFRNDSDSIQMVRRSNPAVWTSASDDPHIPINIFPAGHCPPTDEQHLSYCLGGLNYLISRNIWKIFYDETARNPGQDEGLKGESGWSGNAHL